MKREDLKKIIKEEVTKALEETNVNFENVHEFIKDISKEKPELEWKLGGNHNNVYSGRIKGAQFSAVIWVGEDGGAGRISTDNPGGSTSYNDLEDFYRVIVKKQPAKSKGHFRAYKTY